MPGVASAMERVIEVERERNDLLERTGKHIPPEEQEEFARQAELALLDSNIESIEALGKVARVRGISSAGFLRLRAKAKALKREFQLESPQTQQGFEAALMWIAENGEKEHLEKLRQIKKAPPYSSETIKRLFEIAEERISERVNDFEYVLRKGEEAYQRNRQGWEQQYADQFIALYRGEVIASDRNKSRLIEKIIKKQREEGPFRAFIVEVGASVLRARGPRIRLGMKGHQDVEGENVIISKTNVQEAGWTTFRHELPRLLNEAPGKWVAFHGERQVALEASKLEVYRQLEQAGCPLEEVIVRRIEPLGPPIDLRRFRGLRVK
jgi:hypothetical protein